MRYFLAILLCLWAFNVQAANYLACDPSPDVITAVELEINGTIVPGTYIVSGGDILLYDLTGIPNGTYTAKARWTDSIIWSDWSDTITFKKTGKPGNIHIK